MRVYIDGIFDLFHFGHLESFRKCKHLFDEVYLIVGVIGDETAESYKRRPIISEFQRYSIVLNINYVDEIIKNPPLIIDKDFMEQHNLDFVAHAFSSQTDADSQDLFFFYPKSINKFKQIDYCYEASTTAIIKKIKDTI